MVTHTFTSTHPHTCMNSGAMLCGSELVASGKLQLPQYSQLKQQQLSLVPVGTAGTALSSIKQEPSPFYPEWLCQVSSLCALKALPPPPSMTASHCTCITSSLQTLDPDRTRIPPPPFFLQALDPDRRIVFLVTFPSPPPLRRLMIRTAASCSSTPSPPPSPP